MLDFGLGPDGRLSDLPTAVELPAIAGPSSGGRSLSQLLDEIGDVEAAQAALGSDIRSTEQLIADLTDGLAKAHRAQGGRLDQEMISGACGDLRWVALTVDQLVNLIAALAKRLPPPAHRQALGDAALLEQITVFQNQLQQPLLQLDNGINVHQKQLLDAGTRGRRPRRPRSGRKRPRRRPPAGAFPTAATTARRPNGGFRESEGSGGS